METRDTLSLTISSTMFFVFLTIFVIMFSNIQIKGCLKENGTAVTDELGLFKGCLKGGYNGD